MDPFTIQIKTATGRFHSIDVTPSMTLKHHFSRCNDSFSCTITRRHVRPEKIWNYWDVRYGKK